MLPFSPLKFRVFEFPRDFDVNSLYGLNLEFHFALNRDGLEVPNLCIYLLDVYMFFCYPFSPQH